ncbi:hypothetical protein ACFQDN_22265 [Pseudomonas asuensis]|uniref:Uncharacterized protein n=1 Tax=Pseudomonas asuensis TaxID=1825787 RepID=A0ABQ2H2N9_9PSED|nr:hypothetical protein [Pseudomonas asuensis]GGM25989.1 hypothetical protein GCM10009425_40940 [Pseudomonas asuensis]
MFAFMITRDHTHRIHPGYVKASGFPIKKNDIEQFGVPFRLVNAANGSVFYEGQCCGDHVEVEAFESLACPSPLIFQIRSETGQWQDGYV